MAHIGEGALAQIGFRNNVRTASSWVRFSMDDNRPGSAPQAGRHFYGCVHLNDVPPVLGMPKNNGEQNAKLPDTSPCHQAVVLHRA